MAKLTAIFIRPDVMPTEGVDLDQHKGKIILMRKLGLLLLANSIIIFGIGGYVNAFWSGATVNNARSSPWFGGINGFFTALWSLFTVDLSKIYAAGGSAFFALPVIIAALVLNGQSTTVWSPVTSCGYVTNPSNYSLTTSSVLANPNASPYNYDALKYTEYSYYGMNATGMGYSQLSGLSCAYGLFGNKYTGDDDEVASNTNTCYCFSTTVGCFASQVGPSVTSYAQQPCQAVMTTFYNCLITSECLLCVEFALCLVITYLASSIIYGTNKGDALASKA